MINRPASSPLGQDPLEARSATHPWVLRQGWAPAVTSMITQPYYLPSLPSLTSPFCTSCPGKGKALACHPGLIVFLGEPKLRQWHSAQCRAGSHTPLVGSWAWYMLNKWINTWMMRCGWLTAYFHPMFSFLLNPSESLNNGILEEKIICLGSNWQVIWFPGNGKQGGRAWREKKEAVLMASSSLSYTVHPLLLDLQRHLLFVTILIRFKDFLENALSR